MPARNNSDERLRCCTEVEARDGCCIEVEARDEEALLLPPKTLYTSLLTSPSLDICTESLGCETGAYHFPAPPEDLIAARAKPKRPIKPAACFPPPLTSIGGVHVQTHREAGRLVIKAYASSSAFQAERGDGRLRLSLLNHEAAADGGGGYIVKEDGGKVWSSSGRCNGERRKRLQSLQFCVVGV